MQNNWAVADDKIVHPYCTVEELKCGTTNDLHTNKLYGAYYYSHFPQYKFLQLWGTVILKTLSLNKVLKHCLKLKRKYVFSCTVGLVETWWTNTT